MGWMKNSSSLVFTKHRIEVNGYILFTSMHIIITVRVFFLLSFCYLCVVYSRLDCIHILIDNFFLALVFFFDKYFYCKTLASPHMYIFPYLGSFFTFLLDNHVLIFFALVFFFLSLCVYLYLFLFWHFFAVILCRFNNSLDT